MGMVYGVPFPDIYDWTWGEIIEHIQCKNESRKQELREEASMNFRTVALLAKMLVGQSGQKFNIMDEYSFLWSDEERAEARRAEIEAKFRVAPNKGGDS